MSQDQSATKKELRSFGLLVGAVFTSIGLWPLLMRGEVVRLWAIGLGGALMLLGGMSPGLLKPVHGIWMQVGHTLGRINTSILLGLVFYVLITPMGILFRLIGKDVMRQALTKDSSTYRVSKKPRLQGHMKFQF